MAFWKIRHSSSCPTVGTSYNQVISRWSLRFEKDGHCPCARWLAKLASTCHRLPLEPTTSPYFPGNRTLRGNLFLTVELTRSQVKNQVRISTAYHIIDNFLASLTYPSKLDYWRGRGPNRQAAPTTPIRPDFRGQCYCAVLYLVRVDVGCSNFPQHYPMYLYLLGCHPNLQ